MNDIVSVYSTFGSDDEAHRVARIVVEEGLAACANILAPCRSIYRWRGQVEEAPEVPVIFKTRAERAPALIERVGALHSYDVPAAIVWSIETALESYRAWVIEETG